LFRTPCLLSAIPWFFICCWPGSGLAVVLHISTAFLSMLPLACVAVGGRLWPCLHPPKLTPTTHCFPFFIIRKHEPPFD